MTETYVPSVYIPATGAVTPKLDLRTLQVGDEIPTLSRYGDFQLWNRYAAVNYEFAGHHLDDSVGRHEGFEAAIGMGPFIHALLHVLLREWVGEDVGRVVKVGMQSRRPWIRGRTLIEGGKVTAIREEAGEIFISLEVWGDNDKGERLVIGEAEVATPA
jgi:hypothetical protein